MSCARWGWRSIPGMAAYFLNINRNKKAWCST